MYDLVDRYLRRLDQELHKFKMELEADNRGITEVLEKRKLVHNFFRTAIVSLLTFFLLQVRLNWTCTMVPILRKRIAMSLPE